MFALEKNEAFEFVCTRSEENINLMLLDSAVWQETREHPKIETVDTLKWAFGGFVSSIFC